MVDKNLEMLCKGALNEAHEAITSLGNKGFLEGDLKKKSEIVTAADLAVSQRIIDYFKRSGIPLTLFDEEAGKVKIGDNPELTIVVDPVDGTMNYYRGRGIVLPYSTIITIFEGDGENLKFQDALVTGIIDHPSKNIWYAAKNEGCFLNGKKVQASKQKTLEKTSSIIIDMGPAPEIKELERYSKIRNSSWVRNVSCAGTHFAWVSSGICDAFICGIQKSDEIGAGYLLLKESGGSLMDFEGNPIGEQSFGFGQKYQMIASGTKELGEELALLLK